MDEVTASWLGDDQLARALASPDPNVEEIRRLAVAAFRRLTESSAAGELSPDEGAVAAAWMRELSRRPGHEMLIFGLSAPRSRPRLRPRFFADSSSKINIAGQAWCELCPAPAANLPAKMVPLRTRPMSRQMITGAYIAALKRAVTDRLGKDRDALFRQRLCVGLTFVLAQSRPAKLDLDNMTKTIMDGLEGTLFENDTQVDHLSSLKIRTQQDDEEWIIVRVQPTAVGGLRDVFDPQLNHKWGVDTVDLDRYL